MKLWRNVILILALVWGLAWLVVYEVRQAKPSAQTLSSYLAKHPLTAESGSGREKIINHVGEMLNEISFEDRQTLQSQGVTRDFFKGLTPTEQSAFLDATLPAGFKQMMESFNKMDPEKRRRLVARALEDSKKRQGEGPPPGFNDELAQKMVSQGLKSFYTDANADVKLDMAPLIEQMQQNLQGMH